MEVRVDWRTVRRRKSGIVAEPRGMTLTEKETIIRSFARNGAHEIGPVSNVPAPDMGTNERDMGHIKDAISWTRGWATTNFSRENIE